MQRGARTAAMMAVLCLLLYVQDNQVDGTPIYRFPGRGLQQSAAIAPAPMGEVCPNGFICPSRQVCDVSIVAADPVEEVYSCVCMTGYVNPDCQPVQTAPAKVPPASAPAPATGMLCEPGVVCPVHQRCQVVDRGIDGDEEGTYQCECEPGYNGPECGQGPTDVPTSVVQAPTGGASPMAAVAATAPGLPSSNTIASANISGGIGEGVVVGIVVGTAVLVGVLAAAAAFATRRRRQRSRALEFKDFHRAHQAMDQPGGDLVDQPAEDSLA